MEQEARESAPVSLVYVGTYADASSGGIHWLSFDAREGTLSPVGSLSGIANPSFLAVDRTRKILFAISECTDGAVVSYAIDPDDGGLTEISRQPSLGVGPCHLALDATRRWMVVSHYAGGNVSLLPVTAAGALEPPVDWVKHEGRGAHPQHQSTPHPHSANPDPYGGYLLVADLGTDRVYAYRLDEERARLVECARTQTDSGAGPRHMAFHPMRPVVYLMGELNSTVTVFAYDRLTGALEKMQTVSSLPPGAQQGNAAAHIEIELTGRFLYGSNRGHDSISTFSVGDDGLLTYVASTPSGGGTPRHFCLVPQTPYLLVTHQDSDSIVVMRMDADGIPRATGHLFHINRPVCVQVF